MRFSEELARNDMFLATTEEEAAWLRDEGLEEYLGWLRGTSIELENQLGSYAEGVYKKDDLNWYRKVRSFKGHVDAMIPRLEPLVAKQRQGSGSGSLEAAIRRHHQAMIDEDMDPSEADVALWAAVGITVEAGASR